MVTVRISETLQRDFDVYWLTDEELALGYVTGQYKKENIVLCAEDFAGVDFEIVKNEAYGQ